MLARFRLEAILALLVLLTILAVLGERQILQKSLVIDPNTDQDVHLYDDSDAGGNSEAEMLSEEGSYRWRCELRAQYTWSHCGFEVLFDGERRQEGLDLRAYDRIRVRLEYEGASEAVRLYLRNFDPRYSVPGDDTSTKYNQVEFDASALDGDGVIELSMEDFFVANWWFLEYEIPPRLGHPQFDNIVIFEVHTGTEGELGEHVFELHEVELIGQYLSTEDWYLIIMLTWLALILGFLGYRIWLLKVEVGQRLRREQELEEINALLDMRGRQLEEKARTDSLTGAFNREGIEEAIRVGLWEWRYQEKPLSIVMLDIDHFKQVNDNHGHALGDSILADLSQLVKEHIRASDLFARWGGEEFVLVCRNTPGDYAAMLADKLRELIDGHRFEKGLHITASFGVASLHAREPLEELFKSADEALYEAKRRGRNRVMVENEITARLA